MEYTYKFTNCEETIEIDEEVYALLKEADRLDRNNAQTYHRHINSLEAYGFEPEFMAVEDDAFKDDPTSLAYEYAIRHLRPKHQDILARRLLNGEQYSTIAQSYNASVENTHRAFKNAKERFSRFYSDGLWLFSKENTSLPEADRIRLIPYGLTPSLVQQIRKLRRENKPLNAIAAQLGVPTCRVTSCLRYNPITETKCLNCGASINQIDRGRLQNFCNQKCYDQWFQREGMVHNTCTTKNTKKVYMSREQQIALDYYRQIFVPHRDIVKIMKLPYTYITAHSFAHPLPYTLCLFCGKQVPGVQGRQTKKYCSDACCKHYQNRISSRRKGPKPPSVIPTAEQLYLAIDLRNAGKSYKKIQKETGLSNDDLETLFRFHPKIDKRRKI